MARDADERDADRDLTAWTRANQVIDRRARGESAEEIAHDLNVDVAVVYRTIRTVADQTRVSVLDKAAELFMVHERRLEQLYRVCQRKLDLMVDTGLFDANVIRCALLILERQSRLFDLDRAKRGTAGAASPGGRNDWIDKATDAELVRVAREQYGITIPERFVLDGPVHHEAAQSA